MSLKLSFCLPPSMLLLLPRTKAQQLQLSYLIFSQPTC